MTIAFSGAYFNYDAKLTDNTVLAGHFIHSILHMRHCNHQLSYQPEMTPNELFMANEEFFNTVIDKYKKERGYTITYSAIISGIRWFMISIKEQ